MIGAAPGVNLDDLHPIFRRRLDALAAAYPALSVLSGVRTKARQVELYANYLAGGNLAADPNRVIGERTYFGQRFFAEGSWHMVQRTGYGYAADLAGYKALPNWDAIVPWHSHYLRGIPAPFGLTRTVEGRKPEPWHVQPLGDVVTPYDHDPPPAPLPLPTEDDMPILVIDPTEKVWLLDGLRRMQLTASQKAEAAKLYGITRTKPISGDLLGRYVDVHGA